MSELYFALMEIACLLRCPYKPREYVVTVEEAARMQEAFRVNWQEYARALKPS